MWFNTDIGICDQTKNVYCTFDDKLQSTKESHEENDENVLCQFDSQAIKFISSKMDCGRYYFCHHGRPIKQQSTGDLQWNVVENECDQPSNVRCQVNNILLNERIENVIFNSQFYF